jgi:ABC-type multidrug transport system fused ATPase/permease subunit
MFKIWLSNELFTSVISLIFKDLFLLVGIALVMLVLNWKVALVSFIVFAGRRIRLAHFFKTRPPYIPAFAHKNRRNKYPLYGNHRRYPCCPAVPSGNA